MCYPKKRENIERWLSEAVFVEIVPAGIIATLTAADSKKVNEGSNNVLGETNAHFLSLVVGYVLTE